MSVVGALYARVIVRLALIVPETARATVFAEPVAVTEVIGNEYPSTCRSKALAGAVLELMLLASVKVTVIIFPAVLIDAEANVGAVTSAAVVELLVTE